MNLKQRKIDKVVLELQEHILKVEKFQSENKQIKFFSFLKLVLLDDYLIIIF
jgi:hypothetical protein